MADDTNGNKTRVREFKEQLVKAARMYAMCRKAEVSEPMDVTGLAVAAFEDMQLREAMLFVRTNEQNIKTWPGRSATRTPPRSSSGGSRI